ncbi:hypothetical protein AWQ22_06995 [Picosynechococcus sp. PCC 7117]|nr:hypothetical protein AWQ22_06995 [Picosynechococcus sp. PCC 7117]
MLPNKFRFVHQSKPMIKERLTTCETLLYRWLHFHQNQTKPEELNLQYFQVWTAEFLTEKASGEDIDQALLRLMQLRLIYLNDGGTLAIAPEEQPGVQMAPLPRKFWQAWSWEHHLAAGSLAIASVVLMAVSAFALWQNTNAPLDMTESATVTEQVLGENNPE